MPDANPPAQNETTRNEPQPGRFDRIRRIFAGAMERPADERSAFLDHACAGDADLRHEVDSLLHAARPTRNTGPMQTGGAAAALGTDVAAAAAAVIAHPTKFAAAPLTEKPGTIIGPYKLLEAIGEGGFGTVFLADQTAPVRRRVALKVIKLGMDTRQVVARFEAERQALALMDHPNIAKVFDAGATESGRPYFVMEYVKGDPITLFADAHRLTLRERLEVLMQVCNAVQHAHQKGVIHRDIKPSNVLVSMVDGKPLAKVIDFGIAKATGAAGGTLTDKTLFTEHRALIGTPEYMSPEQAEGSPDIDTRTDVYGLGVLMYELLTGTTPFEPSRLRSAAHAEMQRIIKEEEPPSPSLRITRDAQRDLKQLATTAAQRKVEPQKLNALMRGELDWIVMKAIDKDRGRRFSTPQDLAADVDRHLRGEAVVAAPPSAAYRVRKFVRRNRRAVVTSAAVAAALLVGFAGTTTGLILAEYNARAARNNATLAIEARDQLAKSNESLVAQTEAGREALEQVLLELGWAQSGGTMKTFIADPRGGYSFEVAPYTEEGRRRLRIKVETEGQISSQFNLTPQPTPLVIPQTMNPQGSDKALAAVHEAVNAPHTEDSGDSRAVAMFRIIGDLATESIAEKNKLAESLKVQRDAAEWSAYTANLALAQAAIGTDNYAEARKRVGEAPESKRAWEWQWLRRKSHEIVEVVSPLADPMVPKGAVSNDGRYRVDDQYCEATLWDNSLGVPIAVLHEPTGAFRHAFFSSDSQYLETIGGVDGLSFIQRKFPLRELGGSAEWIAYRNCHTGEIYGGTHSPTGSLRITALLASSPNGRSGLSITTPDGARRIVGGSDKTLRFYEAKDGKPTLPATTESSEGVFREVAVFRMPEAVTNLQMTGDGTRLIIHLADGSARVWDIRDPEERRKDLEAEWAEREPAGAYLDTLWASDTPDDKLRDAIINDASLTPLRRLVAAEMLEERLEDDRLAAEQAFAAIRSAVEPASPIDPTAITAAARARAAAVDLPNRVKARVTTLAAAWEYETPAPTLIDEDLSAVVLSGSESGEMRPPDATDNLIRNAVATVVAVHGLEGPQTVRAVRKQLNWGAAVLESDLDKILAIAKAVEASDDLRGSLTSVLAYDAATRAASPHA